jgi:arylsulfatase A-like enzyme
MWEGGLRVPAIIEWPLAIKSKVSSYPASTMDIVPTILDIVGISDSKMLKPIDGMSLKPLFNSQIKKRALKIPFRFDDRGAMIDNDIKLIVRSIKKSEFELYNLAVDPKESTDIKDEHRSTFKMIKKDYLDWTVSVENSIEGNDYDNPKIDNDSFPRVWNKDERYRPYFNEWSKRPEYMNWVKKTN